MKCPQCGRDNIRINYNTCPNCHYRFTVADREAELSAGTTNSLHSGSPLQQQPIQLVGNNKAIWRISPGEVCRHINEEEFSRLSTMQGVIIEQGVTAVIVVNGQIVSTLSGGNYNFVSDTELSLMMRDSMTVDKGGIFKRIKAFFIKLITGKKEKSGESDNRTGDKTRQALEKLMSGTNVAMYLILDRAFQMLFGNIIPEDGNPVFTPLHVHARNLDVKCALSIDVKVASVHKFIVQYMAGRDILSLQALQRIILPYVSRVVREVMSDVEITESGISPDVVIEIENRLRELNQHLGGVEIIRIVDFTADSDAFERFRQIAQEMYCSEKELGFLQRTNDFKNRLATEENTAKIREARTNLELVKALDEINQDKAIHDDELQAFLKTLSRQRMLSDAKDMATIEKTLNEIEATRIYDHDELQTVKDNVAAKQANRSNTLAFEVYRNMANLQLQQIAIDDNIASATHKTQVNRANELFEMDDIVTDHQHAREREYAAHKHTHEREEAVHQNTMTDLNLNTASKIDQYNEEKERREYERRRQALEEELRLKKEAEKIKIELEQDSKMVDVHVAQAKSKIEMERTAHDANLAMEMLKSMKAEKREDLKVQTDSTVRIKETDYAFQRDIAQKSFSHDENMANIKSAYTAEQLAAEKLDAAGAAEVMSTRKENEIMREYYAKLENAEKARLEREDALRQAELERDRMRQNEQNQLNQQILNGMFGVMGNVKEQEQQNYDRYERIATHRMDEVSGAHKEIEAEKDTLRKEYREESHHAQSRLDETQRQSLNYTTVSDRHHSVNALCPHCRIELVMGVCPQCDYVE